MKRIQINKNFFDLHPSGAIYWVEKKTLMLADVHLGKVAHFNRGKYNFTSLVIRQTHTILVIKFVFLG